MKYSHLFALLLSSFSIVMAMEEKVSECERLGINQFQYARFLSLKELFAKSDASDDALLAKIYENHIHDKCKEGHEADIVAVLKEHAQQKSIEPFYHLLHGVKQSEAAFEMFASEESSTKDLVDLLLVVSGVSLQINNESDKKDKVIQQVTQRVQTLQKYALAGDFKNFVKESGAGLSYCDEIIEQLSKG